MVILSGTKTSWIPLAKSSSPAMAFKRPKFVSLLLHIAVFSLIVPKPISCDAVVTPPNEPRVSGSTPPLRVRVQPLDVPIGRETYLDTSHLSFPDLPPNSYDPDVCKVEVLNEPITQRVGSLDPKVFDCRFKRSTVKYAHFGSPLLPSDDVRFRACRFSTNETRCAHFTLDIRVVNVSYAIVHVVSPLVVTEFFSMSPAIDNSILRFKHGKGASCIVRALPFQSLRPARGQLVIGDTKQPLEFLKQTCDAFLKMGVRYEHLKPPSPDIDYVALLIEASGPELGGPHSEWVHLPVLITAAFPNLPPKASFSSMFLMDVDQFVLTTITPLTLSATDDATPPERLIYNVSRPLHPDQGAIVHLNDHTRPVTSFKHADLAGHEIAYQPPPLAFGERKMFEVAFVALDEDFAASEPMVLHISVRPGATEAPRVLVNAGLTLLEGQSRPILPENLHVVDKDDTDGIKIFVTGGLVHGQLYVRGRPGIVFGPKDLAAGSVVYVHDDSDSTRDSIHLRASDGIHSVHLRFPISIVPKDDSPPSLVTSVVISLDEGDTFPITGDVLRASDLDTPDELITFVVVKPPSAGSLWKKMVWEKTGNEIHRFTQRDVLKGLIHYHHTKPSAPVDEFEVVLQDINSPPNRSPPYRISVRISAKRDHPPRPDPSCSFTLEVPETEVGVISRDMLRFLDEESSPSQIVYTVTSAPRYVGTFAIPETGKLVSLVNEASPEKNQSLPSVTRFTQEEVDHHMVAYLPPHEDIGPHPKFLEFMFSVTDQQGNAVHGQVFNITLLPVNNQPPQLHVGHLVVEEGSSVLLSTNEFSVYDVDTPPGDLQISVFTVPLHGTLRRSGQMLRVGDLLLLEDILSLRLEYVHDGSETVSDSLVMGVNDGIHYELGTIHIQIEPVDDEAPVWEEGLAKEISVEEGGTIPITSQVVAARDVDTDNGLLQFVLTEVPKLGSILSNGKIVTRFHQKDVIAGKVLYAHDGREIGPRAVHDAFTVIPTDRAFPSLVSHVPHRVSISILPKDTQFPRISSRRALLVGEGQRAPLSEDVLTAHDEDTLAHDLRFVVTEQPRYGILRCGSRRVRAGREKKIPDCEGSFTLQDIKKEGVVYVQSSHLQVEPESDSFQVYVTDGMHNSSFITVLISIALRNDEVPQVTIHNLTVPEGGQASLDESVLSVTDRDFPLDVILLSPSRPKPLFGTLIRQAMASSFVNFSTQIPLDAFHHNVVYWHDGSENFVDRFGVEVSDGTHRVRVTIHVEVIPVNDEPPVLVRKGGEKLEAVIGGQGLVISEVILMAVDKDSPPEDLLYKVLSPPASGVLQKSSGMNGTWENLLTLEFTQSDISDNLIRYLPYSNATFSTKDGFQYVVTDGIFFTNPEYLSISLSEQTHPMPSIHRVIVPAGDTVPIDASILSVHNLDPLMKPKDIVFTVIHGPKQGMLENSSKAKGSDNAFTLADIFAGHIIYNHTANALMGAATDAFDFVMEAHGHKTNGTIYIDIIPKKEGEPLFLEMEEPFHVSQNSPGVIGPKHLLAYDSLDTPPEKIVFQVTRSPSWGILLKSGRQATVFSQEDIGNHLVTYHWDRRAEAHNDSFSFIVGRAEVKGDSKFVLEGVTHIGPARFFIILSPRNITITPSVVIVDHLPIKQQVEHLGNDMYGFPLHLGSFIHNLSARFTIISPPRHGHLFNASGNHTVTKSFTQWDVEKRSIWFVVRTFSPDATNDTLELGVFTERSKKQTIRLDFEWAVVQFASPEVAVCEGDGPSVVAVSRKGSLSHSVHVGMDILEHSAKEGKDFVPGRATQVQFDPGVSESSWSFRVVDDGIEESPVEQFILALKDPVDAVLGPRRILLVNIHDKRARGGCPLVGKKRKQGSDDRASLMRPPCDVNTFGLLHLNHSTWQVYHCDGTEWSPWHHAAVKLGLQENTATTSTVSTVPTRKGLLEPIREVEVHLGCPQGWHPFGSLCFRWFKTRMTWNEASRACERMKVGSRLTSVLSKEHNNWLIQLARNRPFWIGLNAKSKAGKWTYGIGNSASVPPHFVQWRKGFPRGGGKYRCVIVRDDVWMNKHCDHHRHGFVCSWTPNNTGSHNDGVR